MDAFGRIVIPKGIRTRYGLDSGAVVEIEGSAAGILLKPVRQHAPVRVDGGVLVLTARAAGDLQDVVRLDRAERAKRVATNARR